MITVIANSGLIAPVNLCAFFFSFLFYGWILFVKPLLYSFWVLLISAAKRFFWRKTPVFQVFTNSANGHVDIPKVFDQLLHRNTRPKSKRQFKLIRTFVLDLFLNILFLFKTQSSTPVKPATSFLDTNGLCSTFFIRRAPCANSCEASFYNVGNFFNLHSFFTETNRLIPTLL